MKSTHRLGIAACLFAAAIALLANAVRADDPAARTKEAAVKEQQLIKTLQTASPAEKALACKQLAIYGGPAAVPELGKLLADEQLASWSRIALEAIPDDSAAAALRDAAEKVEGNLLVGVINSIGVRRDAAATELLTARLQDQNADAAAAAAVALGRIGNDQATAAVRKALTAGPMEVRSAAAEGCVLAAELLAEQGKSQEAADLYDAVRKADVPHQRMLEATRGAIVAHKEKGVELLAEQLRSTDKRMFQMALGVSRDLDGKPVADALAAQVSQAPPERAALVLAALADRNDGPLPPTVADAALKGDKQVRLAAIAAIGRRGGAESMPALIEIATEADPELAAAAKASLAALPGEKVNAELVGRLRKAKGLALVALIEAAGERRVAATAELVEAINHREGPVRRAALAALGETAGPGELGVMIERVLAPQDAEDEKVAALALQAVCIRMPDREACAAKLAEALPKASAATKGKLLEILGSMGGEKSLATIGAAVKEGDADMQDVGTRVLGQWMTVDAAPVLLELSQDRESKFQGRALRGYLRLARQFAADDSSRAEMCAKALAAANRPQDQLLVIEVLQRHPSEETLRVAVAAAKDSQVKDEAKQAAIEIAASVGEEIADNVRRSLLAEIGVQPMKIEIVRATYGAGQAQKDVTAVLQDRAGDQLLIKLPASTYNESFGNPAPGRPKQLEVEYRLDGKPAKAKFAENAAIILPLPE